MQYYSKHNRIHNNPQCDLKILPKPPGPEIGMAIYAGSLGQEEARQAAIAEYRARLSKFVRTHCRINLEPLKYYIYIYYGLSLFTLHTATFGHY